MQRTLTQRIAYACLRFTCRIGSVLVFRLQCLGRHHIPRDGGVFVCSNHQSMMDPVLVGLICNRRLNYLARRTLFHNAAFGWLIRFLDAIPIDRDGLGLDGLKETIRRLRRGEMVLIFPEGTRTQDGQLGPLKPGLCAVARRSAAALLPVGMAGAYESWPRRALLPWPRRIVIQVGPPISAEQVAALSNDALMQELERRMRWCHQRAAAIREGRPVPPALEELSLAAPTIVRDERVDRAVS